MIVNQISIFIENRSGRVAEVLNQIAQSGININALCIADTTSFGILRLMVDDPENIVKKLKDINMAATLNRVLKVTLPNRPGALADVVNILAEKGISIEYMYSSTSGSEDTVNMIFCVEHEAEAQAALEARGYGEN